MKHEKTALGFPNNKLGNVLQVTFFVFAIVIIASIAYETYSPVARRCKQLGGTYWVGNAAGEKCVKETTTYQYFDVE